MSLAVPTGTRPVFTTPTSPPVLAIPWPAARERREELQAGGVPRVLLVPPGVEPPEVVDELEDWVREPVDDRELSARCERVARRAVHCAPRPFVDADGLAWYQDQWTAIPPSQVDLARVLVTRWGNVVPRDVLVGAYADGGGSAHDEALKAAMTRLGRRLASVGLALTKVRGGGYILDAAPAPSH